MKVILKNSFYIPAFLVGLGMRENLADALTALMFLMVLDTITGIMKSAIIYGGRSVKSTIITAGVASKAIVLAVPLAIIIMGKGIGIDLTDYLYGVVSVFIVAETYSVLGNVYAARVKKDIQEFDVISFTIKKIRAALLNLLTREK